MEPPPPVAEKPTAPVVDAETNSAAEEVAVMPSVEEIMETLEEASNSPTVLTPDPDKGQGVPETFSGVLQPTSSALCKLVDLDIKEIIHCYVHGNLTDMKTYAQRPLKITGKVYWAENMEMPIIVPSKIEILSE